MMSLQQIISSLKTVFEGRKTTLMHSYYVSDAKFYLYYLQLSQQCCKVGITPNLPMRKMRLGEVVTY